MFDPLRFPKAEQDTRAIPPAKIDHSLYEPLQEISRLEAKNAALIGLVAVNARLIGYQQRELGIMREKHIQRVVAGREMQSQINNLQEQVYKDGLTQLLNRSGIEAVYEKIQANARDSGSYFKSMKLLYLDLDDFKHINDKLGHQKGDEALIHITDILNSKFRETDMIGRIGGDEFLILLSNTSAVKAVDLAEDVREVVEKEAQYDGIKLGLSIGVCDVDMKRPLWDSVAKADAAMYRAKEMGKNNTAICDGLIN